MKRSHDTAAVVSHPRFRALSDGTQALYLALLSARTANGSIPAREVEGAIARSASRGLGTLIDAGLVDLDPQDGTALVWSPQALDATDALDALADGRALGERARRAWQADHDALAKAAERACSLGTVPGGEWSAGLDEMARRRMAGG